MPALFLSAPSGLGKSYAIHKALFDSASIFYGVITYKLKTAGATDIFITPVTGEPVTGKHISVSKGEPRLVATSRTDAEYCAKMGATKTPGAHASVPASEQGRFAYIFPDVFDDAAAYIENAQNTAAYAERILLLDELGRLESQAFRFQKTVLDALGSPQKTIGVIQKTSTPFLDKVRQNECVSVLEFSPDMPFVRKRMYSEIMDFILS